MSGCHASHDSQGDKQTVLSAEDKLTDAREPPDPRRLPERMLDDVSLCLSMSVVDRRHNRIIPAASGDTS
jgi:hypothetical protein